MPWKPAYGNLPYAANGPISPEKIELEEDHSGVTAPSAGAAAVETAPRTPEVRKPEPRKPEPQAQASDAVEEMQAIAKARALVSSNPSAAVAALEAIAKAHPRGFFVEERRRSGPRCGIPSLLSEKPLRRPRARRRRPVVTHAAARLTRSTPHTGGAARESSIA